MGWGHTPDLESYFSGGLEIFRSLQLDLGYDIEFRQSGTLRAVHNEEQYLYAQNMVLRLRSNGYSVELLSTRKARGIEPEASPELLGFVYMPLRGQADPVKATRAFGSAAEAEDAQVLTGAGVTAVRHLSDDTYQIDTVRERVRAGTVVIAAGAWCGPVGNMAGVRIPVVPVRGQMWATESVPPRIFHTLGSLESELCWHKNAGGDEQTPPGLTHQGDRRLTKHLYGRQTRD